MDAAAERVERTLLISRERRALVGASARPGPLERREARLVAAGRSGTLRSIEPEPTTAHAIAVDRSLYEGYPGFDAMAHLTFVELSGPERAGRLRLAFARDPISAGAAVIATAAAARSAIEARRDTTPNVRSRWRARGGAGGDPP